MIQSVVPANLVLIQHLCHCGCALRFIFFHTDAFLCVLYYSSICKQSMELSTMYFWFRDGTAICCVKLAACVLAIRGRISPLVFWWPET